MKLDAEELTRARAAVAEVSRSVLQLRSEGRVPGTFACGFGGAALLSHYLYESDGDPRHLAECESVVDSLLHGASFLPHLTLYSGVVGLGWLVSHLAVRGQESVDLGALDSELIDALSVKWSGHFDIVSGLAGIGLYAVERYPIQDSAAIIHGVVENLGRLAVERERGVVWLSHKRFMHEWRRDDVPEEHVDYGVAHGIAGVIAFLAMLHARGLGNSTSRRLLVGAVEFLMAQFVVDDGAYRLPSTNLTGNPRGARLAWCYNELGAAVVILCASRSLENRQWTEFADAALRSTLGRWPGEVGVRDVGLCHGAAGASMLYASVYQLTADAAFGVESLRWLRCALGMYTPGTGCGGFVAKILTTKDGLTCDTASPGFLEGAIGAALAMHTLAAGRCLAWARVLGIDSDYLASQQGSSPPNGGVGDDHAQPYLGGEAAKGRPQTRSGRH